MAAPSIVYNGVTVPLVYDPDEWEAREVLAIEKMLQGGIETAGSYGQTLAVLGVSIARVVPTFAFPASVMAMKGRELNPLLRATQEALNAVEEEQAAAAAREAAEVAALSPTSAGSGPVTLPAAPSSPTPGTGGGSPLSSVSESTPATSSV